MLITFKLVGKYLNHNFYVINMSQNIKVAYFSAEIGIKNSIKTFSGGLGVLAGGTIMAMADLKVPFCAITLLYKNGFFKQVIKNNFQHEVIDEWDYESLLKDTGKKVKVNISGEDVHIKIWVYEYVGVGGHVVPIYFLDTNLEENSHNGRDITLQLYHGDRISQELVLGVGGIRALNVLGHNSIEKYHMNEGHSVFLTLELYKTLGEKNGYDDGQVKERCIFTTHTPIPAGHDKFDYDVFYERIKGEANLAPWHLKKLAGENELNTSLLALNLSHYHNAVSKKHMYVSREMFPYHDIEYITNGIDTKRWLNPYLKEVFNKYIPDWEEDFENLKEVFKIPNSELYKAHSKAKSDLIQLVNKNNVTGVKLSDDLLTIGFARRFITYKDAEMLFQNLNDLRRIGKKVQFIFAGKSHSKDGLGKNIMRRIIEYSFELKDDISIAFIENYDIDIAAMLVSGCDLWLNTPIPPNEASGTSGMKAATNGCMHFSRLDGWSIEAFKMNGGGFPISEYDDFINMLEYKIIPMYYSKNKTAWIEEMKLSIGVSGAYFNTHRMAKEYVKKFYKL